MFPHQHLPVYAHFHQIIFSYTDVNKYPFVIDHRTSYTAIKSPCPCLLQGQPAQGQTMQAQPAQGQTTLAQTLQRQPMRGQPLQGQPLQGKFLQVQPMQGQHMQGQPIESQSVQYQILFGQPLSSSYMQGQPIEGSYNPRTTEEPDNNAGRYLIPEGRNVHIKSTPTILGTGYNTPINTQEVQERLDTCVSDCSKRKEIGGPGQRATENPKHSLAPTYVELDGSAQPEDYQEMQAVYANIRDYGGINVDNQTFSSEMNGRLQAVASNDEGNKQIYSSISSRVQGYQEIQPQYANLNCNNGNDEKYSNYNQLNDNRQSIGYAAMHHQSANTQPAPRNNRVTYDAGNGSANNYISIRRDKTLGKSAEAHQQQAETSGNRPSAGCTSACRESAPRYDGRQQQNCAAVNSTGDQAPTVASNYSMLHKPVPEDKYQQISPQYSEIKDYYDGTVHVDNQTMYTELIGSLQQPGSDSYPMNQERVRHRPLCIYNKSSLQSLPSILNPPSDAFLTTRPPTHPENDSCGYHTISSEPTDPAQDNKMAG